MQPETKWTQIKHPQCLFKGHLWQLSCSKKSNIQYNPEALDANKTIHTWEENGLPQSSALSPSNTVFLSHYRWPDGPKRKRKNSQCSVKSMSGKVSEFHIWGPYTLEMSTLFTSNAIIFSVGTVLSFMRKLLRMLDSKQAYSQVDQWNAKHSSLSGNTWFVFACVSEPLVVRSFWISKPQYCIGWRIVAFVMACGGVGPKPRNS